jgi:hypothetical protein
VSDTTTTTDCVLPSPAAGQPALPFKLTGSQAKTAFAIRANCETMIAGDGETFLQPATEKNGVRIPAHYVTKNPQNLNSAGFLTLTLGNYVCHYHGEQMPNADGSRDLCPLCGNKMRFQQVFDAAKASKLFNNLNRRFLKTIFKRAIVVTERHKNKAIHFHLVGILASGADIRTGFDFSAFDAARAARSKGRINRAAETRYKLATCENLRGLWRMMRDELPKFGFGRAELTPIKSTGEAVACYISKYIEKNICNRIKEDKRKKLVRYIGDWKTTKVLAGGGLVTIGDESSPAKIKPNDFAWASKRAIAWRGKAKETAGLIGCLSPEDAKAALGCRWAYYLSKTWQGRTQDDLSPFLIADWQTKRLLTNDLADVSRKVSPGWLNHHELPMQHWLAGQDALELTGCEMEIYRKPSPEVPEDFDAEFARIFETGWKIWKENERERLKKIELETAALN